MQADRAKVSRLLKTARGQIDGILKMVEDDRYCIDIINQLMATGSILKKVEGEIFRSHIGHCVMEAFESGDAEQKNEKIGEILSVVEKLTR